MFQPSHFQKMAKHLGIDSLTYEKEYNGFMAKLKNFHESKGTPFRRLPWLGGQYLDLYLLYRKVTEAGGWVKVTEGKTWRDIAEVFNLPPTCTNAAFALRQHYSRYLESFERINFFGEDAEDVLSAGRPHTPVGVGTLPTHVPSITTSDYISVISTSKDPARNFDKLVLSLQCGMPNEVDFAINICMLLSNVSNSVFNLSKAPAVVDTLLAHVGVFSEDFHGLKELHDEWYFKQDLERDFVKFWKESLRVKGVQEILCGGKDEEINDEESLFHPARRKGGARDVECQRISQVGMILYNFSFDDTNAGVLASHPLCLRFLVLCICSNHGFLQRMAWETLSNLAEKMLIQPIESSSTQMFFHMLHFFLDHKDRYHVTNAMDVLGKLCTLEGNDEVIESGLEPEAYRSLIKVLIVSDVQLVLSSLESLYNLSGVGQVTSDHIAEVHHSIDILVCLVTMDAETFGPEALSEVQILENRVPSAVPATPKPQPKPLPVVPQQPSEPVVQRQAPPPSSPSPGPAPSSSPNPVPIKTTGSEIDPETFTYNWLQGTYEPCPGSSVSRIDIYADYLSSCSRLARVGILNATSFNRIVKLAFPDGQLRRVQSGVNVQYVLAGIKKRTNPLPVKSRTDSPAISQQPIAATPHPPVQRMSPGQQNIPRTPAPPAQNQMPPAWNPPRQQNVGIPQQAPTPSIPRPFDPRSTQVPGGNQQQQLSEKSGVPRRPSFSNQGTIQTPSDQEIRRFPATAMQQQTPQTAADPRQMMGGQMQRNIVPLDKNQSLERLAAMRRASVEGVNASPGQNSQPFPNHNQGQAMQRIPLPPQSPGPPREANHQQIAYPVQGHRMPQTVPITPGQRATPDAQLMAKSPQPSHGGIAGNVHPPPSPLSRSPLPPPRPIQPPTARPDQTPPPGFMPRTPSPAEPSSYQTTAAYRQPAPSYSQQQNIRPAPPAYNSRPAYHGNYPPLAPKPAPGMNVQLTQQSQPRNQVPSNSTAVAGRYPGSPPVPSSPLQQQNFQPQVPPSNMPPSPLLSSSLSSGQPFGSSQRELPGGFASRDTRPTVAQDSRQATKRLLTGRRPEGVVLIAKEERAADIVSAGLIEGAEEQKIVVIENKNRTEISTKGIASNHSSSTEDGKEAYNVAPNQEDVQNSKGEMCRSNFDRNVKQPLRSLPGTISGGDNTPKTTFHPSSNGGLKRNLNAHVLSDSSEENLNGQGDSLSGECGPAKRPRLDKRMSSLENELDNSSSIPSRTGSPTPLVNGDIKGDPRNKLMDKLLDKDLHLSLNGVCDAPELDLLASDGERLSSSKASSPDLFGSETNSDFGKYLEESDTDTGLFSDVLQGDLRIDPMENGTEGTHPVPSKMPVFPGGPFSDAVSIPNEKGVPSGVTEQQGKIPIPPALRPEPQRLHEGGIPGQYNVTVSRNPVAVNAVWNSTSTVTQVSNPGYGHQQFAPEVQQKMSVYPQQGNLPPQLGNRAHIDNKRMVDPQGSATAMQKPQQVITDSSSTIHPSGLPQNTLPQPQDPGIVNSIVPGIQQQPSPAPPPYQGRQQVVLPQNSLPRGSADSARGMQPAVWVQSGFQQQQVPGTQYAGPRTQPGPQKVGPAGFQASLQHNPIPGPQPSTGSQNMSGWQPQLQQQQQQQQQKVVNAYPDIRTESAPTPGAAMYDAASVPQGRQPSVTTPSRYQHPAMPPAGKNVMPNPGAMSGPHEFVSTPPVQGNQPGSAAPQMVSFKPYRCRWASCYSSFDTSKGLFSHVVNEHVPRDSLVMSCMWEGCPPVRRSRSSLLFHLQQKHSEPSPVPSALPPQPAAPQHQPPPVQPPPQPQAPSPNQPASFVPAYHFLARMLQSLQGEEESPLTKSVRLTAALVLRNLAQYSALARSMLRRHESHLSLVAMSNSEAANAIAACLSELSPHRKASSNDSDTFIWALNR